MSNHIVTQNSEKDNALSRSVVSAPGTHLDSLAIAPNGVDWEIAPRERHVQTFLDVVYRHTPQGATIGTFGITTEGRAQFWFDRAANRAVTAERITSMNDLNLFARITPLERPCTTGRGTENDALGTSVLWVDIDGVKNIERQVKRLNRFELPPTLTVSSGYGLHAYWLLDEFCDDPWSAKARNKGLQEELASEREDGEHVDSVFDMARVLRIPGTFNLKYGAKRLAQILEYHPDRVYRLEEFEAASLDDNKLPFTWEAEVLPPDFLEVLERRDSKLVQRMKSEAAAAAAGAFLKNGGSTVDRSRNDMSIAVSLLRMKYTPGQVLTVLSHPLWYSGSRTREKGYDYAVRTLKAAQLRTLSQGGSGTEPQGSLSPSDLGEEVLRETPYVCLRGDLRYYYNGVFVANGDIKLRQWLQGRLGRAWRTDRANEVIAWVETKTYALAEGDEAEGSRVSQHRGLVNVLNGMLNLETRELTPHDPSYKSLVQLPIIYDPSASSAFVDAFLERIIVADAINVLWEFVGSMFITHAYQPKAFLTLVGPPDSGKSKVAEFVLKLLGENNCAAVPFHSLVENRFMAYELYGKLVNIFSDLSGREIQDTAFIKTLTGDDYVTCDRKNKQPFKFKNTARNLYTANGFVPVRSPDRAYFERWYGVSCPNSIPKHEQNPNIMAELTHSDHMSAALNRILDGYARLKANKWQLTQATSVVTQRLAYRATIDPVAAFLEAATVSSTGAVVAKSVMLEACRTWCRQVGRYPVGDVEFYKRMKELRPAYEIGTGYRGPSGHQVECYLGRALAKNVVPSLDTLVDFTTIGDMGDMGAI